MATSDQIKALLKCHADGDDRLFYSIATQIAAQAAKKGHGKIAEELKGLISTLKDQEKEHRSLDKINTIAISAPRGELGGLLAVEYSDSSLKDLILPLSINKRLKRILKEQQLKNKIRDHGLSPKSRVLLVGPPGTGKTLTAKAIAGELHLPLFSIQLDQLLTKFLGESSAKLRLIFDHIEKTRGIYFFDEFDAIGGTRTADNDIGEIRRVLNSFLQFIEKSNTNSIVLAATNHPDMLDKALFRRFDDVIFYEMPSNNLTLKTYKKLLSNLDTQKIDWDIVVKRSSKLNYSEINRVCDDAIKTLIIEEKENLSTKVLLDIINYRLKSIIF